MVYYKDMLTTACYLESLLEKFTQEACYGYIIISKYSRPLGLGSSRGKCSQQPQHILQTPQRVGSWRIQFGPGLCMKPRYLTGVLLFVIEVKET